MTINAKRDRRGRPRSDAQRKAGRWIGVLWAVALGLGLAGSGWGPVGGGAWALEFKAGAAKVDITPPVIRPSGDERFIRPSADGRLGTPLNGYGKRLGRDAIAIHDRVWARCLYLDDGETAALLVAADLCWIPRELRERVLALVEGRCPVPREHIILTATHTHNAQGGMVRALPFRAVSGRFVPEVLEATAQGIAEAVQAACRNPRRAAIGFGVGSGAGLSANRQAEGGPVDDQIGVISVADQDGNCIATVANFAAHPTTVGDEDLFSVSADYPGFFYQVYEELAGEGAVALFLNGAAGNVRCGNPENKDGWARTESIGRLLALQARKVVEDMAFGEATIDVGYATPALPPTIAPRLFPARTVLQTLEIRLIRPSADGRSIRPSADGRLGARGGASVERGADGRALALTFFPGEPCVELGLELRRRALEWGYAAQFSVGLANDFLGYFAPSDLYGTASYEAGMSFYGPAIDDWLYREFGALLTDGDSSVPAVAHPVVEAADVAPRDGAHWLTVRGSAYAMGRQRGAAFQPAIQDAYARAVVDPIEARQLAPTTGLWPFAPRFLDVTPLVLPALAMKVRPALGRVPATALDGLRGLADGAGLPFDAVWLLQCARPCGPCRDGTGNPAAAPNGTLFAAVGDRAGADGVLVAGNFGWSAREGPLVLRAQPDQGRRSVQLGFAAASGAFAGMNDAGVVVCILRTGSAEQGPTSPLGQMLAQDAPGGDAAAACALGLVVRTVLEETDDFDDALARLEPVANVPGYHVLVAAPGRRGAGRACVLEPGPNAMVRQPDQGFLFGTDPGSPVSDAAVRERHGRVADLLREERIIAAVEMERTLVDNAPEPSAAAQILNAHTRCSVVFEPAHRRLRVAFPQEGKPPGAFVSVSLTSSTEAGQ